MERLRRSGGVIAGHNDGGVSVGDAVRADGLRSPASADDGDEGKAVSFSNWRGIGLGEEHVRCGSAGHRAQSPFGVPRA